MSLIVSILLMWHRIPVLKFSWVYSSHRYIPLVMGLAHCKKEHLVHGVLSLLGSTRKWSWHLLSVSCCCILYLKKIAIHALVFLSKYLLCELSNYPFVELPFRKTALLVLQLLQFLFFKLYWCWRIRLKGN